MCWQGIEIVVDAIFMIGIGCICFIFNIMNEDE